jgi:hypothetical protein
LVVSGLTAKGKMANLDQVEHAKACFHQDSNYRWRQKIGTGNALGLTAPRERPER